MERQSQFHINHTRYKCIMHEYTTHTATVSHTCQGTNLPGFRLPWLSQIPQGTSLLERHSRFQINHTRSKCIITHHTQFHINHTRSKCIYTQHTVTVLHQPYLIKMLYTSLHTTQSQTHKLYQIQMHHTSLHNTHSDSFATLPTYQGSVSHGSPKSHKILPSWRDSHSFTLIIADQNVSIHNTHRFT